MAELVGGALIALEGIDGSGTTTQARSLHRWMEDRALDGRRTAKCSLTWQPSTGPVGQLIRRALHGELCLDSDALALLFAADRLDHASSVIVPQTAGGADVICDRHVYSSLAYQGIDLPLPWVARINARALEPDLTVYLRIDPDVAAARRRSRGGPAELFDAAERQRAVSDAYDRLLGADAASGTWSPAGEASWQKNGARRPVPGTARFAEVAIIDAGAQLAEVESALRSLVAAFFRQRGDS